MEKSLGPKGRGPGPLDKSRGSFEGQELNEIVPGRIGEVDVGPIKRERLGHLKDGLGAKEAGSRPLEEECPGSKADKDL